MSSGSQIVERSLLYFAPLEEEATASCNDNETTHAECLIVSGMDAILEFQPQLAVLAGKCGQAGSADHLAYFLLDPQGKRKIPHLLFFRNTFGTPGVTRKGELGAAVILFEYDWMIKSRVFGSFDWTGRRNVLAPAGRRAEIAARAARCLLDKGAHVAHVSFCEDYSDSDGPVENSVDLEGASTAVTSEHPHYDADLINREVTPAMRGAGIWTAIARSVPLYLRIYPTFDATLAGIGKKTRRNLRHYRRRCEAELGSRFVPEAVISLAEFLTLNSLCTFQVSEERARWRYQALQDVPGHFLRGVVDREGQWLCLLGGRRYGSFVEIDWQMNHADRPQYSLSTVMRAYLLEHESSLGSTRLFLEGGTPSSIDRSFLKATAQDLVAKGSSPSHRLVQWLYSCLLPSNNYLRQILLNPQLDWTALEQKSIRARPAVQSASGYWGKSLSKLRANRESETARQSQRRSRS